MAARTAIELTALRDDHPHVTQLNLSFLTASNLYVGQITGSPDRGSRVITVSDISGSISDLTEGQTLLIGTVSGDDDVSRRRFRSRSGQDITVDENSVVWAAGQFVTCIEFWELWPVFPFIEDSDPFTFFKDRDITYTDQNENIDPVAVAGHHQADYLDGPTVTFVLDASDSYAIASGASISSYLWECTSGTIASATAQSTTITFNDTHPDGIWVKLTVTDSNGKSHTTRRVIWVHDRIGADAPHRDFAITSAITGSWESGGWTVALQIYDNALITDIQDKTLLVIWQEATYNGTERIIDDINGNVLFAGYIRRESIEKNRAAGSVIFDAVSVEALLKEKIGFSVSLVDTDSPSKWYEYNNLTVSRAIHHLWHWHSTLLDITDVIIDESTIRLPATDDFLNGDLYGSAEAFASQHGIFAHICCSKSGRLYVEIDIQMLNDADRAAKTVVMDVQENDRRDEDDFVLVREVTPRFAFAMLSGVSYDGTTTTPLIAKAPGEVPLTDGASELNLERQVLSDQNDANERVGRVLAIANAILTDGRVKFAGNYSFVDLVPQEWYTIDIESGDTKRGIVLVAKKMVPRSITIDYDMANGVLLTDVAFELEATGEDGIAGQFPVDVPTEYEDPDDPDTIEDFVRTGRLITFNDVNGVSLKSSWTSINGSLSGVNIQDQFGGVDPWWFTSGKAASINPTKAILWKCNVGKIYRTTNRGVSWTDMTPVTDPPNDANDSPAPTVGDVTFMWYEGNLFVNMQHVFAARWQNSSGDWRSWILLTEDDGTTWTWKFIGGVIGSLDVQSVVSAAHTTTWGSTSVKMTSTKIVSISVDRAVLTQISGSVITELDDQAIPSGVAFQAEIIRISDTVALISYLSGGVDLKMRIVDVAADSITFGAELSVINAVTFHNLANDGTTTGAYIAYYTTTGTPGIYFQEVSISGTTVSLSGGAGTVTLNTASGFIALKPVNPSASVTALLICYGNSSNSGRPTANKITIPFAVSSQVVLDTTAVAINNRGREQLAPISSSSDTFVLAWIDFTSDELQSVAIDITSTVPVAGSVVTLTSDITRHPSIDAYDSNNRLLIVYATTATGNPLLARSITVSGTVITDSNDEFTIDAVNSTNRSVALMIFTPTTAVVSASYTATVGISIYSVNLPGGNPFNKILGLSVSKQTGSKVYVTLFDDVQLVLQTYTLPGLELGTDVSLGLITEAQLDSNEFVAYPYSVRHAEEECYIYGRLNNPIGFGIVHVIFTFDGGSSYSVVEDDWGADYCGSFFLDFANRLYAVRNGSLGQLYTGLISLNLKTGLPFQVSPGAMYVTSDRIVIVGAKTAVSGNAVAYSRRPHTSIVDATEDHPTSGEVTSLVVLV